MSTDRFEIWLAEELAEGPQYDSSSDAPIDHATRVGFLERLLDDPARHLACVSDDELGRACVRDSGLCFDLYQEHAYFYEHGSYAAWHARRRAIRSIFNLFRDVFAPRLATVGVAPESSKLATACYMFWDIWWFSRWNFRPDELTVLGCAISVMERILELDSPHCWRSALHGLGHCHLLFAWWTVPTIDRFVASHPALSPELRDYAAEARRGKVPSSRAARVELCLHAGARSAVRHWPRFRTSAGGGSRNSRSAGAKFHLRGARASSRSRA